MQTTLDSAASFHIAGTAELPTLEQRTTARSESDQTAPWTSISAIAASQADPVVSDKNRLLATLPNTIRVLQVVNGEHYAGAERVQDLLALGLPRHGVQVGLVCVKPGRFPKERQCQQTPVWLAPMANRFDLRPAAQLIQLIRREQIELLHTHNARAALIAALASWWTGVPMIHHVHGQTQVEVGQPLLTRCNAWLEQKILGRCAAIIAVSESVARCVEESGCKPERIFTIPNGVPAGVPAKKLAAAAIPTVGFVAWLRPRKGLETLLESAALLLQAQHPCRLRIVGRFDDAAYEQQIKSLASKLGLDDWIEWRGFRQPVSAELAEMDLLAFPSVLAEGMPMVVLEALAMGVPVIGSRVPGVTDVIQHGHNGWLVDPQDSVELATAITTLAQQTNLWRELRQRGCESHRDFYSDQVMAQRTAALYRRVLSARSIT